MDIIKFVELLSEDEIIKLKRELIKHDDFNNRRMLNIREFLVKYDDKLKGRTKSVLSWFANNMDLPLDHINKSDFLKVRNGGIKGWENFQYVLNNFYL